MTDCMARRWYYAKAMETDEVYVFVCYDSREDGRARFTPHTSFDDPTCPPDAPERESIEIRAYALRGAIKQQEQVGLTFVHTLKNLRSA